MRVEHFGDATLYLGDCREIPPALAQADAVITDLPYGIGVDTDMHRKSGAIEGHWTLAKVLHAHLSAEKGHDGGGRTREQLSHWRWKPDYLGALGLRTDGEAIPLVKATHQNVNALRDLAEHGGLYPVLGAIAFIEVITPREFRAAEQCRDALFPAVFLAEASDSPGDRDYKLRARRYLDDHAWGDAAARGARLVDVIERSERRLDDAALAGLHVGMTRMATARELFYDALGELFSTPKHELWHFTYG